MHLYYSENDNDVYLFSFLFCVFTLQRFPSEANSDRFCLHVLNKGLEVWFCLHVLNKGLETSMWYCFEEHVARDDRMSTSLCYCYIFWPVFRINTQLETMQQFVSNTAFALININAPLGSVHTDNDIDAEK